MKYLWLGPWLLATAACATFKPTPAVNGKEVTEAPLTKGQFLQSDSNRLATLEMRDNLDSLYGIMGKLYRRNPSQWRKTGSASQSDSEARIKAAIQARQPLPELGERRDIAAMSRALETDFEGDRVGALIYGIGDMLVTAHGGRSTFYLVHGLDAQSVYNAARNIEIALWMLAQRKDSQGRPLLLSNELSDRGHNLSFEREFGIIIGRTDLVANFTSEKYRRTVIGYLQGLAGGQFLQFLPVQDVSGAASAP